MVAVKTIQTVINGLMKRALLVTHSKLPDYRFMAFPDADGFDQKTNSKNANQEIVIHYKSESKKNKVSETEIRFVSKYWPEIIKAVQAELNRKENL